MICSDLNIERAREQERQRSARKRRVTEVSRDDVQSALGSWSLGGSFGNGHGSLIAQPGAFYPTDLPGAYFFVDTNQLSALAYSSTPKPNAVGAPPAVQLSGTHTSLGAIRIEIQSSTTFRWGNDNTGTSATWIESGVAIPVGSSRVLPGSGRTGAFPAGTYAAGQVYQETIASIASMSNGTDRFGQLTVTKQPRILSSVLNGKSGLQFDGVDDTLFCSNINFPAPSLAVPIWVWAVYRVNAFSSFDALFAGNSACWVELATATTMRQVCGANGSVVTYAVGTAARIIARFTATAADSLQWRSNLQVGPTAGGSNSTAGVWLASLHDAAAGFLNGTLLAIGAWSIQPTGAGLAKLEQWGLDEYGSSIF